jgi:hypothetical protein
MDFSYACLSESSTHRDKYLELAREFKHEELQLRDVLM